LRKLVTLGVLAALLVGADAGARRVAEAKVEQRARAQAPGSQAVEARIGSFPFLPRLLLSGSVPEVALHLEQVTTGPVDLAVVDIDLRGVVLDRDALLAGSPELQDITGGTVNVELDAGAIERVVRLPVSVGDGAVRVRFRGLEVAVRPEAGQDGSLVLRAGRLPPLRVPLARSRLVSCAAARVTVEGERVRLSCDVTEVPPALRG
jgi:hypothetical protein